MYGIKELAEILELSEKQIRRRLSLILPYLDGHCRKGPRGKILLDERGKEILQEVIFRELAGSSLSEAVRSVVLELQRGPDNHGQTLPPEASRERAGTYGKERKPSGNGRHPNPDSGGEATLPKVPARSVKVEIPEHILRLLIILCALSVLVQIATLIVSLLKA